MIKFSPKLILSAFFFLAFLIISILIFSAVQIYQSNHLLENTIKRETKQTQWSHLLLDIANQRSFLMLKILYEQDAFIQDEMIQKFYLHGQDFMLTRNKFINTTLTDQESNLLNQQLSNSNLVVAEQHRVIQLISVNKLKAAEQHFIKKALPLQQLNSRLLTKLAALQEDSVNNNIQNASSELRNNYFILTIGGIIILSAGTFIAFNIYRKLIKNVNTIQQTNHSLSSNLLELKNLKRALDQHAIVSITDTKGTITSVNDKFCEVSQYNRDELIGQQHNIINSNLHPKDMFRDMWTTINSGQTWHGEIRNQKKDGSYYWVETSIVPFLDNNSIPYQFIAIRTEITKIMDIESDLKLSLEKLAIEAEKAQQSNKLKDAIISTITHELRTPLNSILGFSQLLQYEKNLNTSEKDNVNCIIESGEELLNHIDNIMLYSKLKSGTYTPAVQRSDISEAIQPVMNKVKSRHPESSIIPTLNAPNNLDLLTDISLLQKALSAIIDNAIKFTQQGSVDINVSTLKTGSLITSEDVVATQDLVQIEVTDSGIGIEDDKIQQIFEAFRQVDDKDNRKYEGYGIGLSLAKGIIELLGGNIWINSKAGQGTKVYMTLPVNES